MILVSGGTGLVGAHLLYHLCKKGEKIRALKRAGSDVSNVRKVFSFYSEKPDALLQNIEWVDGDVLDVYSLCDAMKDIQHVYHCAALVSFDPNQEEEMLKINVEGTANMVNAALENNVEKFCHVSSIAALGEPEKGEEVTEQTFWMYSPDKSNYSISKYGAEREVWRASNEGLNVIVINPSLILGTNSTGKSSSSLFYNAYKGMKFYTEGGTGCVDVRDVVTLMIMLMENNVKNESFIINAENVKFKDLFDHMHEAFGKPKPNIKAGKLLTSFAWRIEKIRAFVTNNSPAITKETIAAAHNTTNYSNNKITSVFPNFRFISIHQSVDETCKRF